jgi:hypothetical protein
MCVAISDSLLMKENYIRNLIRRQAKLAWEAVKASTSMLYLPCDVTKTKTRMFNVSHSLICSELSLLDDNDNGGGDDDGDGWYKR